jgi:cell filamentation protein
MKKVNKNKFKETGRYDADSIEGEYEPGSRGYVLKNLIGIKKKREMDFLEAQALEQTLEKVVDVYDRNYRFKARDICKIHQLWLGDVYAWAGRYRQVNISKDSFQFAAAFLIPKLMDKFERDCLRKFTPCRFETLEEITKALAITHTEFVLIHPFREGNGRVSRILATLMGLQAGLPLLRFDCVKGKVRQKYFAAVQAGINNNYEPMENIFRLIINKTLQLSE